MPIKNIWFILGLSGAGKSHLSDYVMRKNNWLHLDIDQSCMSREGEWGDGVDIHGLKPSWILFEQNGDVRPLIKDITSKYECAKKSGAVLSFPSSRVLSVDDIKLLSEDAEVIYLSGSKEDCLKSFLEREKKCSRLPKGKDKTSHWCEHNQKLLKSLSGSSLAQYRIAAFHKDGPRKSIEEILEEVDGRDYT